MYIYAGLEIDGVASQNANHFWGNFESLWQSNSQYCESLLGDLRITFRKKDLFLGDLQITVYYTLTASYRLCTHRLSTLLDCQNISVLYRTRLT